MKTCFFELNIFGAVNLRRFPMLEMRLSLLHVPEQYKADENGNEHDAYRYCEVKRTRTEHKRSIPDIGKCEMCHAVYLRFLKSVSITHLL